MTKGQAIYQWMSSFGLDAYTNTSVPEDAQMPYITYDFPFGSFGDGDMSATLNLWYRTTREADVNQKVDEISADLGFGGKVLRCDGGAFWLKRGTPFATSIADNGSDLKTRLINITVEFMTI